MEYLSFRSSLETRLGKLRLPKDCSQREPTWEVTSSLMWTVELFFDFPDPKHIRIWESYDKVAGLQMSRRVQWSYHYGNTASFDERGNAAKGKPNDPLDLRIDTVGGLHMHYQQREPHYRPDSIEGMDLSTIDALAFIRAIFKHRASQKRLDDVLGFKIKGI